MNCNQCGAVNDESNKYCYKCGSFLENKVTQSNLPEAGKDHELKHLLNIMIVILLGVSILIGVMMYRGTSKPVVQDAEQNAPVAEQSYQEILHVMSDQDLERELTITRGSLNDALMSGSKSDVQQVEIRIGMIESELVARRSARMTPHEKEIIAAAEKNYNPQSANWRVIEESDGSVLLVDLNSIQDMDNSITRIHTLLNLKRRIFQSPMMSIVMINEFDCNNMAVRQVKSDSFTELNGKGQLIGSSSPETLGQVPGKFTPIGQDEGSESFRLQYEFACDKGNEPAVATIRSPQQNVGQTVETKIKDEEQAQENRLEHPELQPGYDELTFKNLRREYPRIPAEIAIWLEKTLNNSPLLTRKVLEKQFAKQIESKELPKDVIDEAMKNQAQYFDYQWSKYNGDRSLGEWWKKE